MDVRLYRRNILTIDRLLRAGFDQKVIAKTCCLPDTGIVRDIESSHGLNARPLDGYAFIDGRGEQVNTRQECT